VDYSKLLVQHRVGNAREPGTLVIFCDSWTDGFAFLPDVHSKAKYVLKSDYSQQGLQIVEQYQQSVDFLTVDGFILLALSVLVDKNSGLSEVYVNAKPICHVTLMVNDKLYQSRCGRKECEQMAKKTCASCKMIKYCCRQCQVSHWPEHKVMCKRCSS
jgi:MYND finger